LVLPTIKTPGRRDNTNTVAHKHKAASNICAATTLLKPGLIATFRSKLHFVLGCFCLRRRGSSKAGKPQERKT
jgi:hypothetical protein